jgi:hypothetical protein
MSTGADPRRQSESVDYSKIFASSPANKRSSHQLGGVAAFRSARTRVLPLNDTALLV